MRGVFANLRNIFQKGYTNGVQGSGIVGASGQQEEWGVG